MSTTVDNRVVEMQFDNSHFEKNVRTSISTLDKLKQSLNLKGASKGLENVNAAAENNKLGVLGSAVETVQAKFSALQVIGITALSNITNAVINTGAQMAKSLTIDPIIQGYREYETQMGSIQTILANTRSKGSTLDDVTGALDELNAYADQTIYNFTEMTRNIGTFTAAGVDLDKSVTSIKGIANLAAVSGSSSMQASNAMYQLSQALATGKVSLMDWNSVVNAGMGGEVFQTALKRTARNLGTGVDEAIEKYGTFRESLTEGQWLTAEVLTETLTQLSGAYTEADLIAQGYTQEQAKEIVDLANTAVGAATEVKTFTDLIDSTKEAVGSGWAKTWQIIFGDFEEAKEMFTGISNVVSGFVNKMSDSRNAMLQEWKDLGGRTALIESFKNVFEGLGSVLKPIGEAFGEVFEPLKGETLANACKSLQEFTSHLKISDESAANLKATFKGVFSVIETVMNVIGAIGKGVFDVIFSVVSSLTGFTGGFLELTGAIGTWLSNIAAAIDETDFFGKVVEKVTGFIKDIIAGIKEFGESLVEGFTATSAFDGFVGFFQSVLDIIKQIGSAVGEAFSSIGSGVAEGFTDGGLFELLNGGLFAGILLGIKKFIDGLSDTFDGVGDILENVTGILDDVRGCFEAYQQNLQASVLLKIAGAIGLLAASLFVISTIDTDSLIRALTGISVLFLELIGALFLFTKISSDISGVIKASTAMISLSVAITILSGALKVMSSIDTDGIIRGLFAIGALMAEIAIFLNFAKLDGKVTKTAIGIVILSSAMLILAEAAKNFGGMELGEIGKGLGSIGALLVEIALFTKLTGNAEHVISTGVAVALLAGSMKILASAMSDFAGMDLKEIGRGLLAMGGSLAAISIAMKFMPPSMLSIGVGLVGVAASLKILADAMSDFAGMSWDEIARGLVVLGGSLAELAIALKLMTGSLPGSAALIVAAGALAIMAPVLKTLGGMSWDGIARGLIALGGAFAVVGVAGMLLGPLVPTLIGLSGAFALFGASVAGIGLGVALIGGGLTAIAAGITALAASIAGGATAIVAGLTVIITGFADLIPTLATKFGEAIVAFAMVIGECAPQLADALLKLLTSVMGSLATYTPQFVDSLLQFLIGVINSLAEHIPTLITAAMNLIGALFQGIVDALNGIDTTNLVLAVAGTGLMTALMFGLSAVVPLIPGAMAGVLGVGAVITELSIVLAAIGGLAQIPGLEWLISEGGDFLQTVGTAIGQFIGGIAGGIAQGITSSFPQIGSDLSAFMTNLQPFIDGAKNLDPSMMDGVKSLAGAILAITAADIVQGITSFLSGGNSMADFANQIVPLGEAMKRYSDAVVGLNPETVTASATAAKALAELANNLPNSGGVAGFFAGENDMADFANQLVPFGLAMKAYSIAVSGIDADAITSSATAAKSLSELANNLPNSGGVLGFFSGENDLSSFATQLVPFGVAMKAYSIAVSGIDADAVTSSATAAKSLAELANNLPNSGGVLGFFSGENDLSSFATQLVPFGVAMKGYSIAVAGIDASAVEASTTAAKSLAELANNLPNAGGLVSIFTGDNSLVSFADQLAPFGNSMKAYSDAVTGFDASAVEASTNAAKALAELANNLPNTGGIASIFTGETDMASFGTKLVPFGLGMKAYSIAVSGIDTEAVTNSATAAKALTELANNMPTSGGVFSIFTGEVDMASFGKNLIPFGIGMRQYSNAVVGIDIAAVDASVSAAKALVEMANNMPTSGGVFSIFTGEVDIASFGKNLIPFGIGMRQYSNAVVGIDVGAILQSVIAANGLVKVAESIPTSGGIFSFFTGESDMSSFATNLVPLGRGIKRYSDAVVGVDVGAISSSVSAAKQLVGLIKGMVGLDASGVGAFKNAINTLGEVQVSNFINAFNNAAPQLQFTGMNMMLALASGIRSGQGIATTAILTSISNMHNNVSSKAGMFRSAGVTLMNGLISGINSRRNQIPSIVITTMTSTVNIINSFASSFMTAGLSLINSLIQGIDSQSSRIPRSIVSALNEATSTIQSRYSDFYNAGSYLVSGFAAGISENTFMAEAKARAMANAAEKAAREALDINSPSKVFKKIGKGVPEGFSMGIGMLGNDVKNSVVSMADIAIDNTKMALSRVGDIVSSDIDAQPSIRPVVDMSAMDADISRLNIGADVSALLSKPVDSLSQIMNDTQAKIEASNREVISAITGLREDMNAYYSADGSEVALYVDSRKLASSLAKPINHQLNVLSRRGV